MIFAQGSVTAPRRGVGPVRGSFLREGLSSMDWKLSEDGLRRGFEGLEHGEEASDTRTTGEAAATACVPSDAVAVGVGGDGYTGGSACCRPGRATEDHEQRKQDGTGGGPDLDVVVDVLPDPAPGSPVSAEPELARRRVRHRTRTRGR